MNIVLVGAELEENLSLRYIMAALLAAGHQVRLIPFNNPEQLNETAGRIAASGAAIAGFSMVFTLRAREFARLIEECRRRGFGGFTLAGGHFAALNAEELLRDVAGLDAVAVGEGEGIMADLADSGGKPEKVAGLVWRDLNGTIVRNPPAASLPLDSLPPPRRKEPPECYLGLPAVNMLGSRGCVHACAFCSIRAWHRFCGGPALRLRDPDLVAAEMAALWHDGIRIFNFHDDNFILPSHAAMDARLQALSEGLRRRGAGRLGFAIKARPDEVRPKLFAAMKELGLFRVFLGIEAGSAATLARLGRKQTPAVNAAALGVLEELDLHVCFNLLVHDPDTTLDEFREHLAFLKTHPAHPMNLCRTEVYAGTPLEHNLRKQGRLRGDYWGWNYRMSDERAQRAFEIWWPAFRGRSHPVECLHHRCMAVDYERQLAGHFFGLPADLDSRAGAFVKSVNLNTVKHLEWVAGVAERCPGEKETTALSGILAARVRFDNARLDREGRRLLVEIRLEAARGRSRRRHPGRMVACLGLAVSLAGGAGFAPAAPAQISQEIAVTVKAGYPPADSQYQQGLRQIFLEILQYEYGRILTKNVSAKDKKVPFLQIGFWVEPNGEVSHIELRMNGWRVAMPPGKPLGEEARRRVAEILPDLKDHSVVRRYAAESQLQELGVSVLPLLEKERQTPRLRRLISECIQVRGMESILAQVEAEIIGGQQGFQEAERGKSFSLSFSRDELKRPFPQDTMMVEIAAAPMIDTTSSSITTIISEKQITDLPH